MKCLYAIAACLSLTAPAPAAPTEEAPTIPTGPGTTIYSGWPPERYMQEFAAVVLFVGDTDPYCGEPPPEGFVRYGCAYTREDGTPIIVVLHPALFSRDDVYARILAHEQAHLAGWSAEHPL